MDKKAKYYKAMNFEYGVVLRTKELPSPHHFWCRLDAITNVAIFDLDISDPREYMKLVHHKERLTEKYVTAITHISR